jgi:para-aminobenzoate synthetase component 1
VERIREYIAAGDIYQANLTLPFAAELAGGADADLACYLALRARSDAGFGAFLRHGGRAVVSHSPECFLAADGRHLVSRPIKGTRRREPGREPLVRAELLGSAKDRAELAMIVDLVRNDLGRVAAAGSVRVAEAAGILDLEYVHHLEATVTADLPEEVGLRSCLAATFPAGSITGAPKIRAMEILAELESGPRGPYCGTFGWVASPRHFALAVAIRTMVVSRGRARFDAGGGIVSDSDGEAEWDEAKAKAAMMAAALRGDT